MRGPTGLGSACPVVPRLGFNVTPCLSLWQLQTHTLGLNCNEACVLGTLQNGTLVPRDCSLGLKNENVLWCTWEKQDLQRENASIGGEDSSFPKLSFMEHRMKWKSGRVFPLAFQCSDCDPILIVCITSYIVIPYKTVIPYKPYKTAIFWWVKNDWRELPGSPVVSDYSSVLSLLRAWVQFLVGELRSLKLRGVAKKKKIGCGQFYVINLFHNIIIIAVSCNVLFSVIKKNFADYNLIHFIIHK